jgi:hypothetical protein
MSASQPPATPSRSIEMKRWIVNFALVAASSLGALTIAELAMRVYFYVTGQPPTCGFVFRMTEPPPYRGSPYFSRAFIDEAYARPDEMFTPPGTNLVLARNLRGRYFNVTEGRRRTVGQPSQAQATLWLFGGSTMYDVAVPDEYTIASRLQSDLNRMWPGAWRVENLGAPALTAAGQLQLLKTVPLGAGDLVIFYDGVNEAGESVLFGDARISMIDRQREQKQRLGWFRTMFIQERWEVAALEAEENSYLVRLAGEYTRRKLCQMPAHLSDPAQLKALAIEVAEQFAANIREARAYTTARNARFLHLLQPNLYSQVRRTPYEQEILRNCFVNPTGADLAFAVAYPLLRRAPLDADLSRFLEDRSPGEEFYLDFCHVNHVADARIARRIAAMVER